MTTEQLLSKLIHWEDPDQLLLLGVTKDGEIILSDQERQTYVTAPTIYEAVIKYIDQVKHHYPSGWFDEPFGE